MGSRGSAGLKAVMVVAALQLVWAWRCPLSAQQSDQPNRSPALTAPSAASTSRPNADSADDNYAAPGIPPPIPADDPTATGEETDGLDPGTAEGQRAATEDGDPNATDGPVLRDGIIDLSDPVAVQDGIDPVAVDTRDAAEADEFRIAPEAVVDPLLLQVEDIDPVRDNRLVRRLAQLEPFDPVGIRIGSFVLFPEVEFSTSYYSNVFRAPDAVSDFAFDVLPSARLVSNWSRHALEFRATGDLSFFTEYDTENDKGYLVESRGRLDINRKTNVQALISHERAQESRSAIDASAVGTRANVVTERAEAAFNHRFNRLSLQFRGSVSDFSYGDVENAGVTSSNSDRDYRSYEEAARATYELKPTLAPFIEVAVNQRQYETVAQSDGIDRSSSGERYRAGLSFGTTSRIVRGEVSLGYGVQTPDDRRLDDIDGLILDANATWRVTELTSLLFNARSDVSETTTLGVGGAFSRFASVELRHAFKSYVIGSAGISYSTQDSEDGIIADNEIRTTLGLEYFLNRETILFGRYAHTSFDGVGSDSDFENDEIHIGVRIRQ